MDEGYEEDTQQETFDHKSKLPKINPLPIPFSQSNEVEDVFLDFTTANPKAKRQILPRFETMILPPKPKSRSPQRFDTEN